MNSSSRIKIPVYACIVLSAFVFSTPYTLFGATINHAPAKPLQGDPLHITIQTNGDERVLSVLGNSKKLKTFMYKGVLTALVPIDLYEKNLVYTISVQTTTGTTTKDITINKRVMPVVSFGIPQKLGGNTATSAKKLVDTLALENASLKGLKTGTHAFWTEAFMYPVSQPIVTDSYGYSRQTSGYVVAHKGTDFRAASGTPVFAMNRGVVRLVQEGRNYGKTIVIDHGLGIQTMYMHLSRIDVREGQLVLRGNTIGLSGMTGYSEGAHLHVSVRIGEVSIDPFVFINLFK